MRGSGGCGACTNGKATAILQGTINTTFQVRLKAKATIPHLSIYDTAGAFLGCAGSGGQIRFPSFSEALDDGLRRFGESVGRSPQNLRRFTIVSD